MGHRLRMVLWGVGPAMAGGSRRWPSHRILRGGRRGLHSAIEAALALLEAELAGCVIVVRKSFQAGHRRRLTHRSDDLPPMRRSGTRSPAWSCRRRGPDDFSSQQTSRIRPLSWPALSCVADTNFVRNTSGYYPCQCHCNRFIRKYFRLSVGAAGVAVVKHKPGSGTVAAVVSRQASPVDRRRRSDPGGRSSK